MSTHGPARVLSLAALALSGCAFFGKSEPLSPRFYDPSVSSTASASSPATMRKELRLGRVVGASHLRERIAYRKSEQELGFYEQRRWTERPEAYVRRALARSIFQERGVLQVVSGVAPTLEVELTRFEEVLAPSHAVRIEAQVALLDVRSVRFERTFTAEQAISEDEFDAVAAGMSVALERVVAEISERVVAEIESGIPTTAEPDVMPATPNAPGPQPTVR